MTETSPFNPNYDSNKDHLEEPNPHTFRNDQASTHRDRDKQIIYKEKIVEVPVEKVVVKEIEKVVEVPVEVIKIQ